jgi:hypothetical protein
MAVVNRSLDASEQKEVVEFCWNSQVSTGATLLVAPLPYPCTVQSMEGGCLGSSGAPEMKLRALRMTSGGATSIILSISNMILAALGTSGPLGYSGLAAAGSTLLNLNYKDVLVLEMAAANSAATQGCIEIVVKKTQDIVSSNGVQS